MLSFCFEGKFIDPGMLGEVQFDMLIDVDCVRRRCEEDRKLHTEERE